MARIPPRRISGQTGGVLCTLRNRLGVEPLVPRTLQVHTLYSLRPLRRDYQLTYSIRSLPG